METLNEHGFKEKFLPYVEHGMGVLLGSESSESEGFQYPAVALVFSSSNPVGARDGLHEVVLGIAGSQADSRLEKELVEDAEIYSWRLPGAFRVDECLRPCYVAINNAVIFANNSSFLRSIVVTASRGNGFQGTGRYRSATRALRDYKYSEKPSFARGLFVLPLIRQSLDGLFPRIAEMTVDGATDPRALRRQIEEEMRQLGLPLTDDAEINRRFQATLKRRSQEEEQALRQSFTVLDRLRWVAFESSEAPEGMTLRVAVQLTDRK